MRISHKHKFVFLAYPRTASTSLRNALDPFTDVASVHVRDVSDDFVFYNHITGQELKAEFERQGWAWEDYTKFCTVRNPFDRAVSLYHHYQKLISTDRGQSLKARARYLLRRKETFPQFVSRMRPDAGLTMSLRAFAFDAAGEPLVDHFIRYEHLDEDVHGLMARLGLGADVEVPRLNASVGKSEYQTYYGQKEVDAVASKYAWDIERFGYSF